MSSWSWLFSSTNRIRRGRLAASAIPSASRSSFFWAMACRAEHIQATSAARHDHARQTRGQNGEPRSRPPSRQCAQEASPPEQSTSPRLTLRRITTAPDASSPTTLQRFLRPDRRQGQRYPFPFLLLNRRRAYDAGEAGAGHSIKDRARERARPPRHHEAAARRVRRPTRPRSRKAPSSPTRPGRPPPWREAQAAPLRASGCAPPFPTAMEDDDVRRRAAPDRNGRADGARRADQRRRLASLAYVDQVLVPELKAGDIVVIGNLGSHKGACVRVAPSRPPARSCSTSRPTVPISTRSKTSLRFGGARRRR